MLLQRDCAHDFNILRKTVLRRHWQAEDCSMVPRITYWSQHRRSYCYVWNERVCNDTGRELRRGQ